MNVSTVQDPATPAQHLSPAEQEQIDAWWRAANYLSVGQIYLGDNPLLRAPLKREHLKPRLLGHWGTIPGLNFIYAHLNRAIKAQDLDMVYIAGPGHGVPSLVANAYLEGRYSELYPHISRDADGLRRLFQQFSCPGGIPGFASPQTPGAVQQGGELGYALSHAYGVVFDHPGLIAACVVGDGEAETGPLAAAWHSNKFLDPAHDGAVLPILHLNGHKTATPAVLARVGRDELASLFVGYGHRPYFVEGDDPAAMHQHMAAALDAALADIRAIQQAARAGGAAAKPLWPMIVLRTPKGWTGPKKVEGQPTEGNWRSHKTPIAEMDNPSHVKQLESWLQSYRPDELFDKHGCLLPEIAALAPQGRRRMSANPVANGGISLKDLNLPELREYAVAVKRPGHALAESTRAVGKYLRDTLVLNRDARNFRLFSPDEASANHLAPVFEVTDRVWQAQALPGDAHLATEGRVMEILCEHTCQGWLEGYLLSGRHGLFACHEAFAHIVDSMLSQHANWLKAAAEVPWRRPLASLNYLLASHVWRQEHPGDPGFIDHVANKKGAAIRVYLPPDANTLLLVTDRCLRSRDCINVIVACEQPQPQYLDMDAAVKHCAAGLGIWEWASNDRGGEPDVVLACAGDVPTLEILAAAALLREHLPELKVRVVNVVDLMTLRPPQEHPHGLPDKDFDSLFTTAKPVIFAYHGYPWLIHRLTHRRANHGQLHVRGYQEENAITTPFGKAVLNGLDRFHLVIDVIDCVEGLAARAAYLKQDMRDKLNEHHEHIQRFGEDLPEIRHWQWPE